MSAKYVDLIINLASVSATLRSDVNAFCFRASYATKCTPKLVPACKLPPARFLSLQFNEVLPRVYELLLVHYAPAVACYYENVKAKADTIDETIEVQRERGSI